MTSPTQIGRGPTFKSCKFHSAGMCRAGSGFNVSGNFEAWMRLRRKSFSAAAVNPSGRLFRYTECVKSTSLDDTSWRVGKAAEEIVEKPKFGLRSLVDPAIEPSMSGTEFEPARPNPRAMEPIASYGCKNPRLELLGGLMCGARHEYLTTPKTRLRWRDHIPVTWPGIVWHIKVAQH